MDLKTDKYEVLKGDNTTKPMTIVKHDKVEETVFYTGYELMKFFSAIPANATRDKVFFLTLLGTGKRVSEILALKKNNIDLLSRSMQIVTLKKRRKRVDIIRIHPDVAYWLSIYIAPLRSEEMVFKFSRQYADDLCKKYANLAGLTFKRASCHNFRHTFAVRWLEQGKPIHKLKKHLGHSHITTTMIYLRIVDQDYNETVDSLDIMGFLK